MKKVNIIAVGKIKEKYLADGIAEYIKRLGKFCEISVVELHDEGDSAAAKERESASILKKLSGYSVLLDLKGESVSSPDLARLLDTAYLNSPSVTFIIGGSHGVTDEIRKAAAKSVSFGSVTYPHQLMRLILLEQIYRGFNILSGTPYHK